MKKIIILIAFMLAVGTAGLAACDNGDSRKNETVAPDNIVETVQDATPETDDKDENTDEKEPSEPHFRQPHMRRRRHGHPHERQKFRHRTQSYLFL